MKRASEYSENRTGPTWRMLVVALLAAAMLAIGISQPVDASGGRHKSSSREDVQGQGGDGIHQRKGAHLTRSSFNVEVTWRIRTPESGTYVYPTPDMVPPGVPLHPPIDPGEPEVFTLWAFVFNYPELCSDHCDTDDIGDTPAQGGIYQLDATIATKNKIRMGAKIRLGQGGLVGVPLQEPETAEIHVAMAPHGMAREGSELLRQLNSSVGFPAHWWPAIFIPGQ